MNFESDVLTVSENDNYITVIEASSGWDPQVLQAFDLLVSDIPSHYGYIAFNSDGAYYLASGTQYSVQGSNVYFGPDCKIAIYSLIDDQISFTVQDIPNFNFTVESGSLVYTNLISGYPDFKSDNVSVPLFLGFGLIVTCLWAVLGRVSRR